MTKVFICYARKDGSYPAMLLEKELAHWGFDMFRDKNSIQHGSDWRSVIDDYIQTADFMIAVCTPEFSVSQEAEIEWHQMADRDANKIIPVKFLDCTVPSRIGTKNYVDATDPDGFDDVVLKLIQHMWISKTIGDEPSVSVLRFGTDVGRYELRIIEPTRVFQRNSPRIVARFVYQNISASAPLLIRWFRDGVLQSEELTNINGSGEGTTVHWLPSGYFPPGNYTVRIYSNEQELNFGSVFHAGKT